MNIFYLFLTKIQILIDKKKNKCKKVFAFILFFDIIIKEQEDGKLKKIFVFFFIFGVNEINRNKK